MPVTLTSLQMIVRLVGTLNGGADLSALTDTLAKNYTQSWSNGTGAAQANRWWHDQRTLSASANESLDLAGGSLVDAFGNALTFVAVKAVIVVASPSNNVANEVQVTRPANGVPIFMASGDGVSLPPGGVFLFIDPSAAGKAVTAGTGDLINIANSAGTNAVVYDIFILGEV